MFISYFTEQPMSTYPQQEALGHYDDEHQSRSLGDTILLFSNRFFDADEGSRLFRERLDQYRAAEEVGFDGIMTNEHHYGAYSMNTRCNIISAVVAAVTTRVKIVQMGNPLPLTENPVQLAEEIAMIDMYSGGRVVAGMVRGAGAEQLANDVNPVFNRDRFEEAHDLIVKAWTTPGPFRWDGDNYQVRVVNPWALPVQKPHPRIWIPGVTSKETIVFAAQHRYPYVVLNLNLEQTKAVWNLYDTVAVEAGYEAGPENRGYLFRCHIADDEETAERNAREFLWMNGEFTGVGNPVWASPTGYSSWESRQAQLRLVHTPNRANLDNYRRNGTIIYGTPTSVLPKIRRWLEETRPGILMFWANDGHVSQKDSMRCIELAGTEVLPAVREMADELDLPDPFSIDAPVGLT